MTYQQRHVEYASRPVASTEQHRGFKIQRRGAQWFILSRDGSLSDPWDDKAELLADIRIMVRRALASKRGLH